MASLTLEELPGALLALGTRTQTALARYGAVVARRMADDAAAFAGARVGGSLARSVEPLVEFGREGAVRAGFVAGRTEPTVRYARVQDEGSGYLPGGVIRPRFMEYLRIPINGARTRHPGGPLTLLHDPQGMRWIPLRARDGWLLVYRGVPSWILVRSVRIKPTHYGRDAMAAEVRRVDADLSGGLPGLTLSG